jgi:serine/threonine-protein kinase HipA
MNTILDEVKSSVFNWQRVAKQIGISRSEQAIMAAAFKV